MFGYVFFAVTFIGFLLLTNWEFLVGFIGIMAVSCILAGIMWWSVTGLSEWLDKKDC
jgi:hypothetical protein